MSIYSTIWAADVAYYPPGPIDYRGSHVLPEINDRRMGGVSVAEIPDHVEREGRPALGEGRVWPWLRLTVRDTAVGFDHDTVLDHDQVEALHHALEGWLQRSDPGRKPVRRT